MYVKGNIVDAVTQLPVEGIGILLQAVSGDCVPLGATDRAGTFIVDVPSGLPNNFVFIHPDYYTAQIDIGEAEALRNLTMTPKPKTLSGLGAVAYLPDAIFRPLNALQNMDLTSANAPGLQLATDATTPPAITPGGEPMPPETKPFPWILVAAGVGAYFVLKPKKKRSKVGAAVAWEKYIIPVGVVVGGYFLVKNLIGGSGDNKANNEQFANNVNNANSAALANLAMQGVRPTLTTASAASLANDIWVQAGKSLFTNETTEDGQSQIFVDISQCKNTADWYLMKQQFGTKLGASSPFSTCALLGFNCQALDLDATVKLSCSPDMVAYINSFFSLSRINYQL